MGGQEELRPLVTVVDYLRVNLGSFKESDLAAPLAGQQEDKTARSRAAYTLGRPPQSERARHRYFQGDFFLKPQLFRRQEVAGTRRSSMRLLRTILEDPLDLGADSNGSAGAARLPRCLLLSAVLARFYRAFSPSIAAK